MVLDRILVSIIVPCYNQGQYLSETLDSVLDMSFKDWQCIIVNDGSTDNTEEVSLSYVNKDSRFKYLYQENQGVCVAKNNAIRESDGKYILPLDSDDVIESHFLEKAVACMESDDNCHLVYGDVKYFGASNKVQKHNYISFEHFLHLNCFCNTCLYRRSDYDLTDGYHLNMKGGWEDWDFYISLLKKYKNKDNVKKIQGISLFYRIKNNSRNDVGPKGRKLLMNIWRNHYDIYRDEIYRTWYDYGRYFTSRAYVIITFLQKMKSKILR